MIPRHEDFEPTGDQAVDVAIKLIYLTQDGDINWEKHSDDPRAVEDEVAQRESVLRGEFYTYTPEGEPWTFFLYRLAHPPGPMMRTDLHERTRHPHLQLLDEEMGVAEEIPYRRVVSNLFDTVQVRYNRTENINQFIRRFAQG